MKSERDVEELRSLVLKAFLDIPIGTKLPGMTRFLTSEQMVALAYYEAVVAVLNKAGVLKDGALDQLRLPLLTVDSRPDHEDYS